jgi:hypothetical protein
MWVTCTLLAGSEAAPGQLVDWLVPIAALLDRRQRDPRPTSKIGDHRGERLGAELVGAGGGI